MRLSWFRRAGCGRAVIAGGLAGLVQLRDDGGEVRGCQVVGLGPGKVRVRRGDAGDQAVGGDVAGGAVRPAAQQDDGDAEIAAGLGDAGQPLRGGGAGSGGQHHRDGLRAVRRRRRCGHGGRSWLRPHRAPRPVRAAPGRRGWPGEPAALAGPGRSRAASAAGMMIWAGGAAGAAGRPGQQAGQDGPGGGWRARAGQAEAAEGGRVGGDLLAVADADGDRAGQDRAGVLLAGRLTGCERGPGRSGGSGLGEAREGRLAWLVQVQVRSGPVSSAGGAPAAGVRAARSRAEMTGAGGAAGRRLEVRTVPGR